MRIKKRNGKRIGKGKRKEGRGKGRKKLEDKKKKVNKTQFEIEKFLTFCQKKNTSIPWAIANIAGQVTLKVLYTRFSNFTLMNTIN